MVAKSYKDYEICSDMYRKENGKRYIKIRKNADSPIQEVRYYTENEYNRMYNIKKEEDKPYYEFYIDTDKPEEIHEAKNWLWTECFCPTEGRSWWLPKYMELPKVIPNIIKVKYI